MAKVFIKWILGALLIALIPAALLGASPGGIALTPIILVFSIVLGAIPASFHCAILAYEKGNKKQQYIAILFPFILVALIVWLVYQ